MLALSNTNIFDKGWTVKFLYNTDENTKFCNWLQKYNFITVYTNLFFSNWLSQIFFKILKTSTNLKWTESHIY